MASGILIIDKPQGWTSMDVCAKLRGALHERRVGHAGTLDPMATGVLPVFVGSATRAVSFAESGDKEYIAGLRLGITTNTQDTTGEILERREASVTPEELGAVLRRFTGPILQVPPMYSAVKIGGQKLYQLARKGLEVERPPRPVTIHTLELLEQTGPEDFTIRVRCSKGTYVRTLCHDIGAALGCGGAMSSLRRTMAAGFAIAQAVTLEEALAGGEGLLLPVDRFFDSYPAYTLASDLQEKRCRNGNPVEAAGLQAGLWRVYGRDGTFLCLSRWEDGALRPVKTFFGG